MFKESLQAVVEGTPGGIAALLMDFEGIPVESFARDDAPFDIGTVGAEFSVIVKSIRRAAEMLEAGGVTEVAVQAEKVLTIIRILNDEYFLVLAMEPQGNYGKGRFMLRTNAPRVLEELA